MAITVTIIKNTFHEALVKVSGTPDDLTTNTISAILTLTELQLSNETLPKVNLAGWMVVGGNNGSGALERDGTRIITLTTVSGVVVDLRGDPFTPDEINNDKDLEFFIFNDHVEIYVHLKKVGHRLISDQTWNVPL